MASNSVYSTKAEAIDREIVPLLGEAADNYDLDGLADEVLDSDQDGYWLGIMSTSTFFIIASKHMKDNMTLEQSLLADLRKRTDKALHELTWVRDHSLYNKTEWRKITNRLEKMRKLLEECQEIGKDID